MKLLVNYFSDRMGIIDPSAFTSSEIDFDLICEKRGWREQCDFNIRIGLSRNAYQCQA
jgi:hypothetical protein